jgi:CheY-like chemotaxis protein
VSRIAVFGAGSWGTAFSIVLADAGNDVTIWGRREEVCAAIAERHENPDYLPDIKLPETITATHDPTVAVDGAEAVAEAGNGHEHDVAIVDIGLPGIDGYTVAQRLRDIQKQKGFPRRLIAMTGYGQAGDKRRAFEAGFDAHLVKPVDPETLTRRLASESSEGDE